MHKPSLDLSLFLLPPDVRVWLLAVWCLCIWAMDHESHALSVQAWRIQREIWAEETLRHVETAPTSTGIAPAPPSDESGPPTDPDEATLINMLHHGWPTAGPQRPHPPRVAIFRRGPRPEDVFYRFGEWQTWEWGP